MPESPVYYSGNICTDVKGGFILKLRGETYLLSTATANSINMYSNMARGGHLLTTNAVRFSLTGTRRVKGQQSGTLATWFEINEALLAQQAAEA